MDLASLGSIILTAFLQALLDRLGKVESFAVDLDDKQVDRLERNLSKIRVVLDNAERRQNEPPVNVWLQRLRKEAYEANDLIDEIAYEDLRRQHVRFPQVRNSTVLKHLSLRRQCFENEISEKIAEANERLDDIVRDSHDLKLIREEASSSGLTSETSSVGDGNVFGRERDAETITKKLLDFSKDKVDFITICGKSGIGKTALAQVVFKHATLEGHFHIKMWVPASYQDVDDTANVKALIKATIESITSKTCDLLNLDVMQRQLQQLLEEKRYLLVLDAMSNDHAGFLDDIKNVLMSVGETGSKVLMTTHKRSISKLLQTTYTHEMESLSEADCMRVIRRYAFCDRNPNVDPYLNKIIERIVHKCNGLPLAAKKYGILLRGENERDGWESISRKEVGEVVMLNCDVSQTLPSDMKRCFAYCSIFPPNFKFDKQQLVQQWMAQDFVKTEEDGREYFNRMFSWSLFQYSQFDYSEAQQTYVMDDDIRSRAQSTAGEECFMMHHNNTSCRMSKLARHASIWCPSESGYSTLSHREVNQLSIFKATGLYTLMLFARMKIPENLAKELQRLRTLDLSNTDLHELPDSIGDLKHLRYLALHNTLIKRLPDSLSKLYHLQSLGLRNCYDLTKLPKIMRDLTKLQHLDLHLDDDLRKCGCLRSMPQEIGKLTSLKTLSRFVVSRNIRCAGINELKNMNDLHGSLLILSLECVQSFAEATNANLKSKEHLQILELRWCEDAPSRIIDDGVLNGLRPHANIRELKIGGYRGCTLSSWIGDPTFSCLKTMKLYNCKNLSKLPSLGQLPSLKKLQLENLPNWKSWSQHEGGIPSLHELVIRDCVNLYTLCATFPALMKMEIDQCQNLTGLPSFPYLHSLVINKCPMLIQCIEQGWDTIARIPSVWVNGIQLLSTEASDSGASPQI